MQSHLVLVCLVLGVAARTQQTWIVDAAGGPGVHFLEVQPAVFAAAPGDRIEVRGVGVYPGFTIDRGIHVEAVAGAGCTTLNVAGVPAGQAAAVVGFGLAAPAAIRQVLIVNCAGTVFVQELRLLNPLPNRTAVQITNSPLVWLASCTIDGRSVPHDLQPSPGLVSLHGSDVVLDHCGLFAATNTFGGTASAALGLAAGSKVLVHGGQLRGGDGHAEMGCGMSCCFGGGVGGAAIGGQGQAVLVGAAAAQGGLGQPANGCQPGGSAPAAFTGVTVQASPDCTIQPACAACPRPALPSIVTPVRAGLGTTAVLAIAGNAGHFAFVAADFGQGRQTIAPFVVPWVLTSNAVSLGFTTLSVQGQGQFTLTIPNLPALSHIEVFFQAVAVDPTTVALALSGPTTLHVQ